MDKIAKNRLFTFLYLLCLYLAATLFDLDMFPSFSIPSFVRIIFYVIVLGITIFEIHKASIKEELQVKPIYLLFLLPLVIPCGSNIIYSLTNSIPMVEEIDSLVLVQDIIRVTICAVIEELMFRVVLLDCFKRVFDDRQYKDVCVVLFDALAFSLMHCINFFGNSPIAVLQQLGYTFVMGLIFALLAYKVENFVLPSVAHVLFNLLNMTLFSTLFDFRTTDMTVKYIVFSAILALISLIYALILYLLNKKVKGKEL